MGNDSILMLESSHSISERLTRGIHSELLRTKDMKYGLKFSFISMNIENYIAIFLNYSGPYHTK